MFTSHQNASHATSARALLHIADPGVFRVLFGAKVRYPNLYKSFEALVLEALQAIRKALGEKPVWPSRQVWDVSFDGRRDQVFKRLQEYPGDVVYELMDQIFELPSVKSAVAELETFKDRHLVMNTAIAYVLPVLRRYLAASPSIAFSREVFDESYRVLEHYLSADAVPATIYMELLSLEGDIDNVRLSDTHRLFRMDHDTARRLWREMIRADDWHRPFISFRFVPNIDAYVLEAKFMVPTARAGHIFALLRSECERSMTALRLAYPQCGSFQYLTHEYEGFFPEFAVGSFFDSGIVRPFVGPLTSDNAKALQRKWVKAYDYASQLENSSSRLEPFLRIAGHRFRDSFDKTAAEDRFLDYSIALEALFSKENDAISYRLPLRAAIFLGQGTLERKRIFEILTSAYRQRSQIAHGSSQIDKEIKIGVQKVASSEFLGAVENCLLLALEKLWLGPSIKKDQLIAAIDECILTQDRSTLPSN